MVAMNSNSEADSDRASRCGSVVHSHSHREGGSVVKWKYWVLAMLIGGLASEASAQLIVAHRGASHDAPENTMAAFRLAWEQGADGIEADFHLSRDGEIVCIHDADTERVAGERQVIVETPLQSLRQLDVGRLKDARWQGERMPTFAEVLAAIPEGKWFFIELKTGPEIVEPLAKELSGYQGDRSKLVIISFKADTIARCKELLPSITAHWLTGFKRDEATGQWRPDAETVARMVHTTGADGVGMQGRREVVDRAFLERIRGGGVAEFHVWTIDDPEDARFFQAAGTVGITTNRPALIRQALQRAAPE